MSVHNFIPSMLIEFSTKAINILHHNQPSKDITPELSLQNPAMPGSTPATAHFNIGKYRIGVRSCNQYGIMHFGDMHFEIWYVSIVTITKRDVCMAIVRHT